MTTSTSATHSSPLEDCQRKFRYLSKRSAKLAARHIQGATNVYECPHLNADGSTHWHISRRRPAPEHAKRARAAAALDESRPF
jgi:hypothetical protein